MCLNQTSHFETGIIKLFYNADIVETETLEITGPSVYISVAERC